MVIDTHKILWNIVLEHLGTLACMLKTHHGTREMKLLAVNFNGFSLEVEPELVGSYLLQLNQNFQERLIIISSLYFEAVKVIKEYLLFPRRNDRKLTMIKGTRNACTLVRCFELIGRFWIHNIVALSNMC